MERSALTATELIDKFMSDHADSPQYKCYFVKDHDGRILTCNQSFYTNAGFDYERQILGRCDHEIPKWQKMASSYNIGELLCLKSGMYYLAQEMLVTEEDTLEPIITEKRPFITQDDKVILLGNYQRERDFLAPKLHYKADNVTLDHVIVDTLKGSVNLSAIEIRVLYLKGICFAQNKEISHLLLTSESNVKKKINQLYDKLNFTRHRQRNLENLRKVANIIFTEHNMPIFKDALQYK